MSKKEIQYDCRLMLGFSPSDPEQVKVVNFLKTLGRKKSFFITKAVVYYLENCPNPEIPGKNVPVNSLITEDMVRKVVMEMMVKGQVPDAIMQSKESNLDMQSPNKGFADEIFEKAKQERKQAEDKKKEKTENLPTKEEPVSIKEEPIRPETEHKEQENEEQKSFEEKQEPANEDVLNLLAGLAVFDM